MELKERITQFEIAPSFVSVWWTSEERNAVKAVERVALVLVENEAGTTTLRFVELTSSVGMRVGIDWTKDELGALHLGFMSWSDYADFKRELVVKVQEKRVEAAAKKRAVVKEMGGVETPGDGGDGSGK